MCDILCQVENVNKIYGKGEGKVNALRNVNLQIYRGDFVSITGTSGSGKSTLLHILGLLDNPSSGNVTFNGTETSQLSAAQKSSLRCRNIGFVFQDFKLFDELTVKENIMIPCMIAKKKTEMSDYYNLIGEMQLQDRESHLPGEISGGQRQRVAIARALINSPELILCDEPTGNLDKETGIEIVNLLKKINAHGTTIVMVTHDLEIASQSKKHYKIEDGEIMAG